MQWFRKAPAPSTDPVDDAEARSCRRPLTAAAFERLTQVVDHLPDGPFTVARFRDHAIGLNWVHHCDDIVMVLAHLTETKVVRVVDAGQVPTWEAVAWSDGRPRIAAPVAPDEFPWPSWQTHTGGGVERGAVRGSQVFDDAPDAAGPASGAQ